MFNPLKNKTETSQHISIGRIFVSRIELGGAGSAGSAGSAGTPNCLALAAAKALVEPLLATAPALLAFAASSIWIRLGMMVGVEVIPIG